MEPQIFIDFTKPLILPAIMFTDLIFTTYGMHSHVLGASHNGFTTMKLVVVDFHSIVPMVLITMAPLITMFNSIMLPPNLGKEPP
jgi:hypothetical protein